jgi:hypothetical protein
MPSSRRLLWIPLVLAFTVAACTSAGRKKKDDGSDGSDGTDGTDGVVATCENGTLDPDETDVDCGGACGVCADGKSCADNGDCKSGTCGVTYVCLSSACGNGKLDPPETKIDCGGDCPLCLGDGCSANDQCQSGFCDSAGTCAIPSCTDGIKNGAETGVDCGAGDCSPCTDGQGCLTATNCASGFCNQGKKCATPSCTDAEKNADETDVDCGGSCGPCADGKACADKDDCESGKCNDGKCTALAGTCADGQKNGDETDLDCGGGCDGCGFDKDCKAPGDCKSGICNAGKCSPPASCSDGDQSPGETDVDCGGSDCPGCALGQICKSYTDCLSVACGQGRCVEPACPDEVLNGDETDVDCGGPECPACGDGKKCTVGTDCDGGNCTGGFCGSCTDGKKNGNESDVDCGGACDLCALEKACQSDADCASNICDASKCVSCSDGKQNGNETDVDCGGSDCDPCTDGDTCKAASDCQNGACGADKTCCTPNACGSCGAPPAETCNGKDDDCDGGTDEELTAEPCANQKGACTGSKATCSGSGGWKCSAENYTSPEYQGTETTCDKVDNDCDGQTDEGSCAACGAAVTKVTGLENLQDVEIGYEWFAVVQDKPAGALSGYNTQSFDRYAYIVTDEGIDNVLNDVVNGPGLASDGSKLYMALRQTLSFSNYFMVGVVGAFNFDDWLTLESDIPDGNHMSPVAVGDGKLAAAHVQGPGYQLIGDKSDGLTFDAGWDSITLSSGFDSAVHVKIDDAGLVHYLFRIAPGAEGDLVYRNWDSGDVEIAAMVGVPDLAVSGAGDVYAVYLKSKTVTLHAKDAENDEFDTPVTIASNISSQNVAVDVGPDGLVYVAWVENSFKVGLARYNPATKKVETFGAKTLGAGSDLVSRLEIEVEAGGLIHIGTWMNRLDTDTFYFATTCKGYTGETACTPNCSGKLCGDNGCGGSCGTCTGGKTCNASGQCVSSCTPNCAGKTCGDNGCGGACGTCTGGKTCNASGQCVASTGLYGVPAGCIVQTYACNPVSNQNCQAGHACDQDTNGNFVCYPPPNDVPKGGSCDNQSTFCQGGASCYSGVCTPYCCSSADCTGGKACTPLFTDGTIGICL